MGIYVVAKLALLGLTKEIAKEVARENIRVNCIAAGPYNTKYGDAVRKGRSGTEYCMIKESGTLLLDMIQSISRKLGLGTCY